MGIFLTEGVGVGLQEHPTCALTGTRTNRRTNPLHDPLIAPSTVSIAFTARLTVENSTPVRSVVITCLFTCAPTWPGIGSSREHVGVGVGIGIGDDVGCAEVGRSWVWEEEVECAETEAEGGGDMGTRHNEGKEPY